MSRPARTVTSPSGGIFCGALIFTLGTAVPGQFGANYRGVPIRYGTHKTDDPIAKLQRGVNAGRVILKHDRKTGYLPALLAHLGIPTSSQGLVFSKTSFQIRKIAPRNPRAVYFGDEVYVGFVPGGTVLEVTAMDAKRGPIFYTLGQSEVAQPKFVRRTHECLSCHGGSQTEDWPGHLVRSVYPKPSGDVETRVGSFLTTQASPFEQRWGGWYVTGTHGAMRHMGNATVPSTAGPEELDLEPGANITDLASRFPTSNYLTPHSDIVALMVLEHQTEMHNLIARAGYRVRAAQYRQHTKNKILELPRDHIDANTKRVIRDAANQVLEHLLFRHEVALPSAIRGTSGFAKEFSKLGPRDSKGRSLHELDLKKRLFRYPCSYVIYSPCFDAMPQVVLDRVYLRLWRILTGTIGRRSWRLTRVQRQAILDILLATKRGLPPLFEARVVR